MKRKITALLLSAAITVMSFASTALASDYGSEGAKSKDNYTIQEILTYAIQDEYLAKAEYQKIMDTFGEQRPFSNIIKAEENHIRALQPLFSQYGIPVPSDTSADHLVVPADLSAAYQAGVQAEINNIAMYESFLKQDLPADVKLVIENLKAASEKHLNAFERGVSGKNTLKSKNTGAIKGKGYGSGRYGQK